MTNERSRTRTLLVGAAGRDFHSFNVAYRSDPTVEVVAFATAQRAGLVGRRYPGSLAGLLYPAGIPIEDEARLDELCRLHRVHQVVCAYSDVTHATVMHLASRALAAGADFVLLGPDRTMLVSRLPVAAVSAVLPSGGKSQTARWLARRLGAQGHRVAVLRPPMPHGDLAEGRVQRFAALADLAAARCSAEEREAYEPYLAAGNVVFAGVDYAAVLRRAEAESDVIVWDGGHDFPFVRPDVHVVVAEAPEAIAGRHPGAALLRMADVVAVTDAEAADPAVVERTLSVVRAVSPRAVVGRAAVGAAVDGVFAVRSQRAPSSR